MTRMNRSNAKRTVGRGFTLIELLVVVAVIALLVSILLPSLAKARQLVQGAKCKANQYGVGRAIEIYVTEFDVYPAAYLYRDADGDIWPMPHQGNGHPGGYVHFSGLLLGNTNVAKEAFACPTFRNGGLPRTNPGPSDSGNWETGQIDQQQVDASLWNRSSIEDLQAPRTAYTGNAAILVRNKFAYGMVPGQRRLNQFVAGEDVRSSASTILMTEFNNDWKKIAVSQSGGWLSKSHRPISPIVAGGGETSSSVYSPDPAWTYGQANYHYHRAGTDNWGVLTERALQDVDSVVESNVPEINGVGRHHNGGDDTYGGTANFLFADGHVESRTPMQTMEHRQWGDEFYGVTGDSRIVGFFDDED